MKNIKAFTLIELLVVVLIIGILAAIAVPQYQKAVRKSELSTLKAKTKAIAQAVNAYYLANNTPASYEALDISLPDVSSVDNSQSGLIEINFSEGSYCKIWDPTWKRTACFTKEPKMGFYYTYDTLKPSHCMALNSRETDKKVCKQEATSSESSYSTYTYYYY